MRVALLDGAVDLAFLKNVKNLNVHIHGAYNALSGEVTEDEIPAHGMTHASVCAGIFLSKVKVPCELWCIRVLDGDSLRGNVDALLAALDFCVKQRMDIVNLSVGTTRIRDGERLSLKIRELADCGAAIIAAESNRKLLTFPAALEQVIGVREDTPSNRRCFSDSILYRSERKVFTYEKQSVVTGNYNSYAAPAVTAEVCCFRKDGITDTGQISQMLKRLKNVRENKWCCCTKTDKPVILLDIREDDTAVRCMEKILRYFERNEYEGVCISDTLQTDYAAGRLSLWQFARNARRLQDRLGSLTSAVDADFVIWHINGLKTLKQYLRQIDIVVTDRTFEWRGWKNRVISDVLDEEALYGMLNDLT